MTYSLGFRAPSVANLLARRVDRVLECLSDAALLEDGLAATLPTRPGRLQPLITNARDAMHNAIMRWMINFGWVKWSLRLTRTAGMRLPPLILS